MCQVNFLRGKGHPLRRNAGYVFAALHGMTAWEMGTAISCKKCSQVAVYIHAAGRNISVEDSISSSCNCALKVVAIIVTVVHYQWARMCDFWCRYSNIVIFFMFEDLFVLPSLMPKMYSYKLSISKKYSISFLVPISTPIGVPALQKQNCKVANYKISMYKKSTKKK